LLPLYSGLFALTLNFLDGLMAATRCAHSCTKATFISDICVKRITKGRDHVMALRENWGEAMAVGYGSNLAEGSRDGINVGHSLGSKHSHFGEQRCPHF